MKTFLLVLVLYDPQLEVPYTYTEAVPTVEACTMVSREATISASQSGAFVISGRCFQVVDQEDV